jgi:ATP synthase (E/31 kDa) subunit.
MLVSAQLEMKKKVLAVKRDMIEAVFAGVIERISRMPDDQYREVIASMLLNAPLQGDEEVLFRFMMSTAWIRISWITLMSN